MTLPLFSSHYSNGKSILSLAPPKKVKEGGPDSIIKLCLDHGIKTPFLIEDSMTGFMEAWKTFSEAGLNFNFGWKTNVSNDLKSDDQSQTSKIIILIKNTNGYYDLIKIHNASHKEFSGTVDHNILTKYWSDNLIMAIPFYDSYIFNNILLDCRCQPRLEQFNPVFFREDNGLPFDSLISMALPKDNVVDAKTIYYNKRSDFTAWQVYKCLCNVMVKGRHRTINLPMFEHCYSREFCLEAYLEKL